MAGKLYGVGVGPGDSELLTLKAVKVIRQCDVIAAPGRNPKDTIAYRIADGACPQLSKKRLLGIHMPMTKDRELLEKSHQEGFRLLKEQLDAGRSVAFLTLGDPTIYSTYLYLHREILRAGYETEIVSGIPSFCAAAARLNMGIAEKAEQIHVIPASYEIESALKLPGTKILMKAGGKLAQVKKKLQDLEGQVIMVENCGMKEEHVYYGAEEIPENAGYYTLLFVKEEGEAL